MSDDISEENQRNSESDNSAYWQWQNSISVAASAIMA